MHPDLIRQRRIVADLEQKAAAEASSVAVGPARGGAAGRGGGAPNLRLARVDQVRTEIDTIGREIVRKEQEERRLRGLVSAYQARVEAATSREADLTELMRDYETLERSYTTLLAKKDDAQVSANLERRQIGEPFRILDPARLPEKPFSPKRPQLDIMGAALGLALGLGLTALLEYLDSSLKTEDDVVQALMLPVLALIPFMANGGDERRSRKRRALVLSCVAAAVVLISAAAAAWKLDAVRWVR